MKKFIKSVLFGLLAVLVMKIVSIIIVVILERVIPGPIQYTIPPGSLRDTIIIRVLQIMYYLAPFIGGLTAALYAKQNGWLYGALMGVVLVTISIISIFVVSLTLPATFSSDVKWTITWRQIANTIIYAPKIILLTTLGGFFGQGKYEKQ